MKKTTKKTKAADVASAYKSTWTYHGKVALKIFGGYIFNHGTASAKNDRTKTHVRDCNKTGDLTYEVLVEKQDRLFGSAVIAPTYDKEFITRVVERINTTVLKNSTVKAMTLKDWKASLPGMASMSSGQRGFYESLCKAKLSETECCFIPEAVSQDELNAAIDFVEQNWYYKYATLRVSAKMNEDKTKKELKYAARPIPTAFYQYVLQQVFNYGADKLERLYVQSICLAYVFYLQMSAFSNLKEIYVLTTGDDKKNYADIYKLLKVNSAFKLIECDSDSEILEEYKRMPNINPDCIVMNPPYSGNLHLQVLSEALSSCKPSCLIINISPIRWMQDIFATEKASSDLNMFKDSVYNKITALELISAREGQEAFGGIVLTTDLGIYTFNDMTNNSFTGLIPSTAIKIKKQLNESPTIDKDKQDGWRARVPSIISGRSGGRGSKKWYGLGFLGPFYDGKKDGKWWHTFYVKNQYSKETPFISKSIKFATECEANNFCDSLNTTFGRYTTYHLCPDANVRAYNIMWLKDYSKPWTNERLCEHFNISGFISDTEAAPGSEWEEILNFVVAEELM